MRPIKFRAWDNDKGCWYAPTFEAYKGNLWELFVSFSGRLSAHTVVGMSDESVFPDRYKLMQYTGLKDKNGVEIYEGDILAKESWWYRKKDGTPDGRAKTRWLNKSVVTWGEHQDYADGYECNSGTFFGWDIDPYELRDGLEVIGNIYENPELLKGEK